MTTFRGLSACTCLAAWLPAFEKAIGRQPRLFQLVGDAKASAGFHKGGGSADYEPLDEAELRICRNMGGAGWNRWWKNRDGSTNYHCHIRLNGCPHNTIAQPQVTDLNEGRDGTGPLWDNAGVPDNGPRKGVHWPLRTWRQGIEWANQQEDDMFTDADRATLNKLAADEKTRAQRQIDWEKNAIAFRDRTLNALRAINTGVKSGGVTLDEVAADTDRLIAELEA